MEFLHAGAHVQSDSGRVAVLSLNVCFLLQLRREKIDLENTLEQEQEALVNRLWKRMDKLEAEKRCANDSCGRTIINPDTSVTSKHFRFKSAV